MLPSAYTFEEVRLAVKELTEQVVLGLVEQGSAARGVTLYVGYQILSKEGLSGYHGPVKVSYYGRKVPPSVHGTGKLDGPTASLSRITEAVLKLYDKLVDRGLEVRRMSVATIRLSQKEDVSPQAEPVFKLERRRAGTRSAANVHCSSQAFWKERSCERYGLAGGRHHPGAQRTDWRSPKMSVENWAKLFTPFSALHGFDIESLIKEQERLLVPQAALSADQQDSIWRTLNGLQRGGRITVTCFVPVKRWGEHINAKIRVSQQRGKRS